MRRAQAPILSPVTALLLVAAVLATALASVLLVDAVRATPLVPARLTAAPVMLDEPAVRRVLRQAGFDDVDDLRRRGEHYSAIATMAGGTRARLVIHGTSGALIGIRILDPGGRLDRSGIAKR